MTCDSGVYSVCVPLLLVCNDCVDIMHVCLPIYGMGRADEKLYVVGMYRWRSYHR